MIEVVVIFKDTCDRERLHRKNVTEVDMLDGNILSIECGPKVKYLFNMDEVSMVEMYDGS